MAKNSPQRIDNVSGRKVARSYFMQHRSEQNEILPADQSNFNVGPACQRFIKVLGGIETGKPAACDNYFHLFPRFWVHRENRLSLDCLPVRPNSARTNAQKI